MPTSDWAPALVNSPVGQELLYGTHPPVNYRVKYACSYAPGVAQFGIDQCGEGGWCSPGTITFANVGEDEMCIGVAVYWALDRVLGRDGSVNGEAMSHLESGDVDQVGTPGSTPNVDAAGICADCEPGL